MTSPKKNKRGGGLAAALVLLLLGACEGVEPQIDPLTAKDDCADCPPGLFTGEERDIIFYPWPPGNLR